jgi:two-component system OmpR family sensor kinase
MQGRGRWRRASLRNRVFWSCLLSLTGVAGVYCILLGILMQGIAWSVEARSSLRFMAMCWLLAQPAIWLVSWWQSRWIVRHIESPIAALIARGRRIREEQSGTPAARSTDDSSESRRGVDELLSDLDQVVVGQYRFVADAAHELRTPLTAQCLVGENVLARRASPAELREAISSMLEEGRHMRRLIDGLLELTRASLAGTAANADKHEVTPLDLSELANGCVQTLQVLAEERGQHFEVVCEEPVWVDADLTLVRQALLNVIHNAIEHCPEGTHIRVETAQNAGDGLIRVIDDGPGIAPSEQQRAFERFHRGPGTAHRRGLGLGLSIAKAILRSQGGNIQFQSVPTGGCCFTLVLPLVMRPQVRLEQLAAALLVPQRPS